MRKEFKKDDAATTWELELRDYLQKNNLKHIELGFESENLISAAMLDNVIYNM